MNVTPRELRLLHIAHRLRASTVPMSPGKIHKASNAESILRHCLRRLGFTAAYRKHELTQAQRKQLFEEIRQYGRAWLRHEAEQFVAHHVPRPVERRLKWKDDPSGFLVGEETGLRANLSRFFKRAKQFVREVIVAGVLSLLGPAPLTGEELDAAEREAQKQEQFFDKFQADAVNPLTEMTPNQFIARVEKYADTSWQAPQRINRNSAITQGVFKVERRVLGQPKTEHCHDCPPLAAMGWQPLGSLPHIGESECGPLCLCHFEYAESPDSQAYFQGKKGPVPAPAEPVVMLPDTDEVTMIAEPPGKKIDVPVAGPPKR